MPAYISAQVLGSTLAAGTLRLLFNGTHDVFFGTSPQGSDLQAFVMEFIITFYLMFIISGVATDNRAVSPPSSVFTFIVSFVERKIMEVYGNRFGELSSQPHLPTKLINIYFTID